MWSSIGPGSCSPGNKFMLLDRIALIWVPSSPFLYWLEASLHFALEKGGVGMSVYLEFPNVSSHSLVELLWFFCWQKRTVRTVTSDVWGCIQVNLGCWGIHLSPQPDSSVQKPSGKWRYSLSWEVKCLFLPKNCTKKGSFSAFCVELIVSQYSTTTL